MMNIKDTYNKLKKLSEGKNAYLFDYVERVKNLDFNELPFSIVDALILSLISYYRFDFMEHKANKSLKLEEAEHIYSLDLDLKLTAIYNEARNPFIKLLAKTKRYKDLRLFKYERDFSAIHEKQFSAISIELNKNTVFVSFSGTDSTMTGIKEDMNMAYLDKIPSQLNAKTYINDRVFKKYKNIYIGGHSKGGNLAIYAGMKLNHRLQKRIKKIFNFDGPGFIPEILEKDENKNIIDKIITIVPEMSVIGMIFNNPNDLVVIDSFNFGVFQHDPFSWKINKDNHFAYKNYVSNTSRAISSSIKDYFQQLDADKRRQFIDLIWYFTKNTAAYTLSDFKKNFLRNSFNALVLYGELNSESKKVLHKHLMVFIKSLIIATRKLEEPETKITKETLESLDNFVI